MEYNLKKIWPAVSISMLLTIITHANSKDSVQRQSINPPGMPLTRNGWDLQISADALLWQLQEDGLIYAVESTTLTLPVKNERVKQKYNWGFRIGLDWTIPHDNWDIAATWTHLVSNQHGNSTATAGNVLRKPGLILSSTGASFTTASAKYHNCLEQFSLNIGREFFVSKWVTLRPFFGFRADCLRQRLHASYSGIAATPTLIQVSQRKTRWQGIGIESGLNTQWSFCGGFSLYGNIAGAIEYGLQKQSASESGIIPYPFNDSFHICRPIIDLQLGLGWDYNFCEDGFHLGWKLGWENHVYFHQSRFFNAINPAGDLTYQGWTLHVNFDF